jgi:hypothetical protein
MISSFSQVRSGNLTTISVTSTLSAPSFYWYVDGVYVGVSKVPSRTINVPAGDQVSVDVLDSTSPSFDPIASAPAGWSARRSLTIFRSLDAQIDSYLVEQRLGAGSWAYIGTIRDNPQAWSYSLLTPRLIDLGSYTWRVTAINKSGNAGTPLSLGASETIVRTPDAPKFTASFDAVHDQVLFAAA